MALIGVRAYSAVGAAFGLGMLVLVVRGIHGVRARRNPDGWRFGELMLLALLGWVGFVAACFVLVGAVGVVAPSAVK